MTQMRATRRRLSTTILATAIVAATLVAVPATAPLAGALPAPDPALAGEAQYPFVCTTAKEDLGQPVVDNQDGQGIPVVSETVPGPGWADGLAPEVRDSLGGDVNRPYPNRGGYPALDLYQALGLADPAATSFADLLGASPAWLEGHSRDCRVAAPLVEYLYLSNSRPDDPATSWAIEGDWRPLADTACDALPADMIYLTPGTQIAADDPRNVVTEPTPFIIRRERGEVNRFLYSIAALAPCGETPSDSPSVDLWNGRLAFHFGGGVGIGHTQGRIDRGNSLYNQELQRGYAVLTSTGTGTSHHYNLLLGGRTAVQTKARFVEVYGEPVYTVGVGGSGGGIQQYVYGQNHPGLLDGGVPQYAYPDMVTQTIHIGDCELLEHYFEKTDAGNSRWGTVENRIPVMGLNAETAPINKGGSALQWTALYGLYRLLGYQAPEGGGGSSPPLTECRAAWSGLTAAAMNPTFQFISDINRVEGYDLGDVEFTHWADAIEAYGVDEEGWARVPWGNVGLQYGLRAVATGALPPEEFLRLNALIGSWKETRDQVAEGVPYSIAANPNLDLVQEVARIIGLATNPETREQVRGEFDPWSSRNMNLSPDGVTPAPRRAGDPIAIDNAMTSGQVFTGAEPGTGNLVDIPFIDWRHYLEEELDMHNTHQSFAVRQRLINARGDYDNQLVWFTDARPARGFDQTPMAFDVLERWITTMQAGDLSAAEARSQLAADWDDSVGPLSDACFSTNGQLQYAGDDAWGGMLDDGPEGTCITQGNYAIYSTSRIEAGAPITGDSFGCGPNTWETPLIPVRDAVVSGYYGSWNPSEEEIVRLEEIFPTGVCGYAPSFAATPTAAVPRFTG